MVMWPPLVETFEAHFQISRLPQHHPMTQKLELGQGYASLEPLVIMAAEKGVHTCVHMTWQHQHGCTTEGMHRAHIIMKHEHVIMTCMA